MEVGLADKHGAGLAQASRDDGIGGGDVIAPHLRRGTGAHALLIDQVFEGQRNAVQRADSASGGDLFVGLPGLLECFIAGDGDKRVQLRIALLDDR
jgi:hypothetical protein